MLLVSICNIFPSNYKSGKLVPALTDRCLLQYVVTFTLDLKYFPWETHFKPVLNIEGNCSMLVYQLLCSNVLDTKKHITNIMTNYVISFEYFS